MNKYEFVDLNNFIKKTNSALKWQLGTGPCEVLKNCYYVSEEDGGLDCEDCKLQKHIGKTIENTPMEELYEHSKEQVKLMVTLGEL